MVELSTAWDMVEVRDVHFQNVPRARGAVRITVSAMAEGRGAGLKDVQRARRDDRISARHTVVEKNVHGDTQVQSSAGRTTFRATSLQENRAFVQHTTHKLWEGLLCMTR